MQTRVPIKNRVALHLSPDLSWMVCSRTLPSLSRSSELLPEVIIPISQTRKPRLRKTRCYLDGQPKCHPPVPRGTEGADAAGGGEALSRDALGS